MTISGEVIQIHVGQAGVQIATACWELYCLEHGIGTDGCMPKIPDDDYYTSFFALTKAMKVIPRLIMIDSEPNVIDEVRKSSLRHLFHPDAMISSKDSCGSNYARGYHTIGGEMIDYTMDCIRRIAETCQNLRGFLLFRAIGGGTGSGLGNLILERIQKEYGKIPRMEFIIFPSPTMSPLIAEPYNAVLATHKSADLSECSFLIDNEALYGICAKNLDVPSPMYSNLNRIIAQVVSGFTISQRFYGHSNVSFGEFPTNLVPYPRVRFPLVSFAPLLSSTKSVYGKLSTSQLTYECFAPSSQLAVCDPSKGKCMACVLLYRGANSPGEVNTSIANLKRTKTMRFVDWSPAGIKISINPILPCNPPGDDIAPTNRSLVALTNNTAIQHSWCRLTLQFNKLFSRRAFIHHYVGEGMEEATLKAAEESVCALLREYQKVDSEFKNVLD